MKTLLVLVIALLTCPSVQSQKLTPAITRIDPTNWWIGMNNPDVQLLVYGPNAGTLTYTVRYPGVNLVKVSKVENPNYAFLDLRILPSAKPGILRVVGQSGKQTISKEYELKAGTKEAKGTGVTSADLSDHAGPFCKRGYVER
jgi:hypothetical protein